MTHTLPALGTIEYFLECVRGVIEPDVFGSGQCHTLAGVMQEIFGGEMFAIMRHEVTEQGERFSTTYSHMVCEIDNQCYDIDGQDADERWCSKWSEAPDEEGLTSEFEFVAVAPTELLTFIGKHRGNPMDHDVLAKLRDVVEFNVPVMPSPSFSLPAMR